VLTPLGALTFPLALLLFLRGRTPLFHALVFAIPFFHSAVAVIGSTRVAPFHVLAAALLLRQLIDGQFSVPKKIGALLPILFLTTVYLSLAMPLLLEHRHLMVVTMATPFQQYEHLTPLRFSAANVTQVVYPTASVVLYLILLAEMRSKSAITAVVRTSILSSIVVVASGLMIQLSLVAGTTFLEAYLYAVTGSGETSEVLGWIQRYSAFGGLPRMFSLAGEPSFTGAYLVFAFALSFVAAFSSLREALQFSRWFAYCALALYTFGLVLTGSSTEYV
jgi:hypothetical protein